MEKFFKSSNFDEIFNGFILIILISILYIFHTYPIKGSYVIESENNKGAYILME